jgi:hypothetical protein
MEEGGGRGDRASNLVICTSQAHTSHTGRIRLSSQHKCINITHNTKATHQICTITLHSYRKEDERHDAVNSPVVKLLRWQTMIFAFEVDSRVVAGEEHSVYPKLPRCCGLA